MKGHADTHHARGRAYWTTHELAERYGVDLDTIYALAASGGLPHQRFGRVYRFPIEETTAWEKRETIVNNGPSSGAKPQRQHKPAKSGAFTPKPYTGPLKKAA